MGTVDERMYQLLVEIDELSRETDEEGKLPLYSDTAVEELYKLIKKFMTDMGENIVRSQAVDEFVEYINKNTVIPVQAEYITQWFKQFKEEKGL